MPRNIPVNPPPYQATRGYRPAAHTGARDNESNNLRSHQHFHYGSVPAPQKPERSYSLIKILALAIGLCTLCTLAICFYPSIEQTHDKIRREWEVEERNHQALRDAWNSERRAMVVERTTWQKEREAAAAEREQWKKEQVDHENRQRQEEEEKRASIVWENLTPSSKCLRYGTREYSATLTHVPIGMDPMKECWQKTIDIHGRQMPPSRCDTQGMCGTVTGHWDVDFNEATCVTWWRGYDDKGCVERGIHRYESVLENLQWGDDWQVMCATTPGRVQGRNFDGPTSCASWRSGINAIWLVEDENCY